MRKTVGKNKFISYQIWSDLDLSKFVSTAGASVHSTQNSSLNFQKILEVFTNKLGNFLPMVHNSDFQWFLGNQGDFGNCSLHEKAHDQPWLRILAPPQLHSFNSLTISKDSIFFSWKRVTFFTLFWCLPCFLLSLFFQIQARCWKTASLWKRLRNLRFPPILLALVLKQINLVFCTRLHFWIKERCNSELK